MNVAYFVPAVLALVFAAPLSPAKKSSKKSSQVRPLPKKGSKSKGASKGKSKKGKGKKGTVKLLPRDAKDPYLSGLVKTFPKLPALEVLREQAQNNNLVPQEGDSPLREVARLDAATPMVGNASMNSYCANVSINTHQRIGHVMFNYQRINFCRSNGSPNAGVGIRFTAEAGRAYAVDCSSSAATRFQVRHRIGRDAWSHTETIPDTRTPRDFVIVEETSEVLVSFEIDPEDYSIPTHSISECRISQIGG